MRYLLPITSLSISVFAIFATPWPTADQVFNPYAYPAFHETVEWLDPRPHANFAHKK